jgi:hypothetical protein
MKKKYIIFIIAFLFLSLGTWRLCRFVSEYRADASARAEQKAKQQAEQAEKRAQAEVLDAIINSRRVDSVADEKADVFGPDDQVKILLIGVDKRAGQTSGHCDVIQLITIDRKKQTVNVTAVPRGTYSPLPPGKGATSSDYYVSNACGLGGLDYGIKQIEKILGQKEDYLVVVGFSEALGILRNLKLPTTETLQWLRHRQGYAIGEPQRAHNHSTFIKQMIIKYFGEKNNSLDKALQYVVYKIVKTDLSFAQTQSIADVLCSMDLIKKPERIQLAMRPAYTVQDIPYAPEKLGEYLDKMITPIKNRLSKDDYSGTPEATIEEKLLKMIDEKKADKEFMAWAYENNLWLQIETKEKRLCAQSDILGRYLEQISTSSDRQALISDYILEMENYGEEDWAATGTTWLKKELGQK